MAQQSASEAPSGATGLHRAPTWARGLDFGSSLDLDLIASPVTSSPSSPRQSRLPSASGNNSTSTSPRASGSRDPSLSSSSNPRTSLAPAMSFLPKAPTDSTVLQPGTNQMAPSHSKNPSWSSSASGRDPMSPDTDRFLTVDSTPMQNTFANRQSAQAGPSRSPQPAPASQWAQYSSAPSLPQLQHQTQPYRSQPSYQFASSADMYASPSQDLDPARPGNFINLAVNQDDNRKPTSSATHASGEGLPNNLKRSSVLSFQTAYSGTEMADSRTGTPLQPPQPPFAFSQPNQRPTTPGTTGSFDRVLPGGWGGPAVSYGGTSSAGGLTPANAYISLPGTPVRGSPAMSAGLQLPQGAPTDHEFYDATAGPSASRKESPEVAKAVLSEESRAIKGPSDSKGRTPTQLLNEADGSVNVTLDRNATLKPSHARSASGQLMSATRATSQGQAAPTYSVADEDTAPQQSPDRQTATLPPQTPPKSDPSLTALFSKLAEPAAPSLPSKESAPPLPTKEMQDLSLNTALPPPLPAFGENVSTPPMIGPSSTSPVSDFRKKPLADVTPAMQAQGIATLQEQKGVAGIGAHNTTGGLSQSPVDEFSRPGRQRASSNAGLLPRAALVEGPVEPPAPASAASSIETPSREPSPPPEGEVEARAEWERAMMKQKGNKAARDSARKSTLRGQLKPLQLLPADQGRQNDSDGAAFEVLNTPALPSPGNARNGANGTAGIAASGAMSTQQLQRQQARDQRRSVGQINLAMGSSGDFGTAVNGPYPMFASPSQTAAAGGRLYSGMLPQRSLVPPFELQQRPDGLLSGLIGPDGVRRSVNDPEVCLECMMRDEDMIDVHVLGAGLWDRESDKDFEEALHLEVEEDGRKARERGTSGGGSSAAGDDNSAADHSSSHATSREGSLRPTAAGTKIRVRRVGKYDPLTADRLKLHTQMNPPASSHRWRTLQNFLAVQAKYIAMEQRARQDDWQRSRDREVKSQPRDRAVSGPMAPSGVSPQLKTSPQSLKGRHSTNALAAGNGIKSADDANLDPAERSLKERDIALAREARRKNVSESKIKPSAVGNGQQMSDDDRRRHASSPVSMQPLQIPRKPTPGYATPSRGPSNPDLRSPSGAMLSPMMPSTPDSLVPPTFTFASTPKGFGNRTTSQVSLAPSGSLLDMHLAMGASNQADHRAGHGPGHLPIPPPMTLDRSRSASMTSQRPFAGIAEIASPAGNANEMLGARRPSFQDDNALSPVSPDLANAGDTGYQNAKKKKKGLSRFFSRVSGGGDDKAESMTDNSGSPRLGRAPSLATNDDDTLAPPPGIGGLLLRARRSTSSLLGGRDSIDQPRNTYAEPPGMGSRGDAFDMGPFQAPLAPERKQSMAPTAPFDGQQSRSMGRPPSSSSFMPPTNGHSNRSSPVTTQTGFSRGAQPAHPNFSPQNTSPTSSRTPSMMSLQSRTNPRNTMASKLSSIDASPLVSSRALEPEEAQLPPRSESRASMTSRLSLGPSASRQYDGGGLSAGRVVSGQQGGLRAPGAVVPEGDESIGRRSLNLFSSPFRASGPRRTREDSVEPGMAGPGKYSASPAGSMRSFPGGGVSGQMQTMQMDTPLSGGDYGEGNGLNADLREQLGMSRGVSTTNDKAKKNKLKLPFGLSNKNKGRSSNPLPASSGSNGSLRSPMMGADGMSSGGGGGDGLFSSMRSRASSGAQYDDGSFRRGGAESPVPTARPRKSMNLFERPRVLSQLGIGSPVGPEEELPPRSQSSLGTVGLLPGRRNFSGQ